MSGVCAFHGKGAKLKWRPARGRTAGMKTREYFYVCDTGMGDRRLRQPSLASSLVKMTRGDTGDTRDISNSEDTATTVGQGMSDVQTRAGTRMTQYYC